MKDCQLSWIHVLMFPSSVCCPGVLFRPTCAKVSLFFPVGAETSGRLSSLPDMRPITWHKSLHPQLAVVSLVSVYAVNCIWVIKFLALFPITNLGEKGIILHLAFKLPFDLFGCTHESTSTSSVWALGVTEAHMLYSNTTRWWFHKMDMFIYNTFYYWENKIHRNNKYIKFILIPLEINKYLERHL